MNPKISVVMSVYNQAQYLPQAIDSILGQSFTDFEFLILNDASTDPTLQVLSHYRDRRLAVLTHRRNLGVAASLNHLIRRSRGEYLARMDADDIAHKNRFKIQLDYLNKHLQVAACGTAANLIDIQGKKIGQKLYPSRITKSILMRYNPLIHPSVMIRKSFLPLPSYNPSLNGAEDYNLWLHLASKYKLTNLSQVLLDYRVNPQGISWKTLKHTEFQAIKARFKALKDYNYPQWQIIYLVKPLLSYLFPSRVKKLLFNIR